MSISAHHVRLHLAPLHPEESGMWCSVPSLPCADLPTTAALHSGCACLQRSAHSQRMDASKEQGRGGCQTAADAGRHLCTAMCKSVSPYQPLLQSQAGRLQLASPSRDLQRSPPTCTTFLVHLGQGQEVSKGGSLPNRVSGRKVA